VIRPFDLIKRFAVDPNSVLERQFCTLAVYAISQFVFLLPWVSATENWAVLTGAVLMTIATAATFALQRPTAPMRAAMAIPLIDLAAVGFLRAGTGGWTSIFSSLLILPILSLGVEPGRLPLLLGGVVTTLVALLPMAIDPTVLDDGQWIRVIFTLVVLGLTGLSVNELTRRLRSRMQAVQLLRREQDRLLAEATDNATASAESSRLLRESTLMMTGVLDAVTEQSIIATDQSGRIEVFNTGAQRMLGVAAHDAVGRRNITDFYLPEELEPSTRAAAAFSALVSTVRHGDANIRDWTYRRLDASILRVQVTVTARHGPDGEIEGFLFVATDVTDERKQARMKDEFVNLISHELRTPLSSILGYTELISDDQENPLTAEQAKYLATVERNAQRLLRLVSDLLFTAQVESGGFALQEQRVDLRSVLGASLESARPVAAAREVRLALSQSGEPLNVWGDSMRLGQAVDNLVSNAIKFTPPGGRVAVTLGRADGAYGEPDSALIAVTDTGIGIPADEIDRLFGRFFRASTATQFAVPGVGLGLTITQAIAVAHHGRIRVASTVGEGTTFTFELPLLDADDSSNKQAWTTRPFPVAAG
jgi:PAS domain S-box-containing protein